MKKFSPFLTLIIFIAALLFLVSAGGFSFSTVYPLLISFRILAGMGVGVASNISPLYISEIAPAKKSGRLVTFYQLAITIGILFAYMSNFLLQRYISVYIHPDNHLLYWLFAEHIWRGMFLVGLIPATVFFVLLFIVPESPRWLVQYGRNEEALLILSRISGKDEARFEMQAIKNAAIQQKGGVGNSCIYL